MQRQRLPDSATRISSSLGSGWSRRNAVTDTTKPGVQNPHWTPPDWHYYEKAAARGLTPVHLEEGQQYHLSDGTYLEIRGEDVGRVNQYGNFYAWTPGMELIFDDKIYIPPFGTRQRMVPNVLGPHKLVLGDGYLIHGVHDLNENSIGTAASHGCIRMNNDDLTYLYSLVETGTRVDII